MAACFWERRSSSSLMALISEAEEWVGGDVSRGGGDDRYAAAADVSGWTGGAVGSPLLLLCIWRSQKVKKSQKHRN